MPTTEKLSPDFSNKLSFVDSTRNELDELYSYRKGVELLAKNNSNEINYNLGSDHAMIVMEHLIDKAQNNLNIFAGSFDDRVCNTGKSNYYKSLEQYLIRGGMINVLLNSYIPNQYNRTLDLLKQFSTSDKYKLKIKVRLTSEKPLLPNNQEFHFSVADEKAFREEYDITKFAAKFSFNRPDIAKTLNETFFAIFNNNSKSQDLDLSTLTY